MTGILIMSFGVIFLLHQLGVFDLGRGGHWWPYLVIGFGLVRMAMWTSAERVGSGFGLVLFGCWFLITVNRWWGFDWSNSWPLALVAVGLSIMTRALLEPLFRGFDEGAQPGGEPHA